MKSEYKQANCSQIIETTLFGGELLRKTTHLMDVYTEQLLVLLFAFSFFFQIWLTREFVKNLHDLAARVSCPTGALHQIRAWQWHSPPSN